MAGAVVKPSPTTPAKKIKRHVRPAVADAQNVSDLFTIYSTNSIIAFTYV
jgi:hypothetical protein